MADQSMLSLEEGQLLSGRDGELVRVVKPGERVFTPAGVPRILGKCQSGAADAGREDFAHVIERAAVGVRRAQGELLEQVVGTEFGLQSVVVGERAVVALQYDAFRAVS